MVSDVEKKKHGIKNGMCTLIYYNTFGAVLSCCSKKIKAQRKQAVGFFKSCQKQIDYFLDGSSLITNQILSLAMFSQQIPNFEEVRESIIEEMVLNLAEAQLQADAKNPGQPGQPGFKGNKIFAL